VPEGTAKNHEIISILDNGPVLTWSIHESLRTRDPYIIEQFF
jgi:hypothetical protein